MRLALALLIAGLAAAPAVAQTAAAPGLRVYDVAPWWMDKPVIPSVGYVWTELPANRAEIAVTYRALDRDLAQATRAAAQKARAIAASIATYGPDKARVTTTFDVTPLYQQYRDKQGEKVENERADKIESYQVSANVEVEIRDTRLVEPIYALLMSGKPAQAGSVQFSLQEENETRTEMFKLAVADARRRAELGAQAAGARIGAVRVIDPSGRACQTDILLSGAARGVTAEDAMRVPPPPPPPAPSRSNVEELVVTAQRRAQEAGLNPEEFRLPVQAPMERLEATACVVYSLVPAP
jgi:uncharacterized protein YggE